MTSSQIAREVPDVPQASLYRHIRKLQEGGVLTVAGEKRIHGAVERTYRVDPATVMIDPKKLESRRGKSAHYFEVFLSCLRQAFIRYTSQPRFDLKADGAQFYFEFVNTTDAEQIAFNLEIRRLIEAAKQNLPTENRKRRILSYIALPDHVPTPALKGKS